MIYPWQQSQWQSVQRQVQQQRLPHALLLLGPQGMGKLDFARTLARQLLCAQSSADDSCVCRECQLFAAGSHPDFYTVDCLEKSRVIKIDQVRELNEKLALSAQRGGMQVVIINPADALNRASANALLKTLEEPSGSVQFLLLCQRTGALPATILSRTQQLPFTLQEQASALTWLRDNINAADQAELLLRLADYAPLRALQLDQQQFLKLYSDVVTRFLKIIQQQASPIAGVNDVLKGDVGLFLQALLNVVLDVVRLRLGVTQMQYGEVQALQQLANLRSAMQWCQLLTHIQDAQRLLNSSAHVNVQLLVEDLLIEIAT